VSNTSRITVKEKEYKTLKFTIKESSLAKDVSSAAFSFSVKKRLTDTTAIISKTNSDFDVTEASDGIVRLPLSTTDLTIPPFSYSAELTITFSATSIVKSQTFILEVERSVS